MYAGKRKAEWSHTSSVLSIIADVNRNHKKRSRPFEPWEFLPDDLKKEARRYLKPRGIPLSAKNVRLLKAFVRK